MCSTRVIILTCLLIFSFVASYSQTSWRGTSNTNWNNAANWTNGIPTATTDVILGDANFTGINQPTVNATASCKSVTVGGSVATILTLRRNLSVSGNVTINSNGTITQPGSTLTLSGNWTNNGTYVSTNASALIIFGGVTQSIGGTSVTSFRRLTINTSSTTTLTTNTIVTGTNSYCYVYGTLNPGEPTGFSLTSTVLLRVFANGRIRVNAATFNANYVLSGTVTLSAGSIVDYSSSAVDQEISSAYTYSTLRISGTGTKFLSANLPNLNSTTATAGNILVTSGTLNLMNFTANRGTTVAGGEINLSNGTFLKIGGTNTFPANFSTRMLNLSSTVEYNGTAQNVSAQTYGNLILSSSAGAATKTMPVVAFIIEGNFTSTIGSGTGVSFTAASNITANGNVTIGAATTFNSGAFSHTVGGNWINNGTFTGSTGTVTFSGPSTTISGTGIHSFNNISFTSTGIKSSATSMVVSGNMLTTGAGQFTHQAGCLLNMTGAAKSITGTGIVLNDLTISGSVTTTASFSINGNLLVSGSIAASSGTITMPGTTRTISGAGTIGFSGLTISGSVVATTSFSLSALLQVSGTFSATSGTATFTGTAVLSGTANLFNVTINGTSLQLAASAVLGIANIFTITAGVLNVTATIPNTVEFNGTGAQAVNAITYNNLRLANGNTKTASGGITVNGNLTIGTSTTFAGGNFTHTLLNNWTNNGSYLPAAGTVQFTGNSNAIIAGVTGFNIITINKTAASNTVTLVNNVNAVTVNMTTGSISTLTNTLTITGTRTGPGIITGTITRTHAFTTGVSYAFESPENTILFSSVSGVTSITVTITPGDIAGFPNGAAINRQYTINVPAGTYVCMLRLHYEDAELNGNAEGTMALWNIQSGNWTAVGKTGNNTTTNYVERSGLTNITNSWTCSESTGVVRWNGSVSSDWSNAANWTAVSGAPAMPPSATDVVQIGTGAFTFQPAISTAVTVKNITYGSVQASTLTLNAGGSLTTAGNISGTWTANATHTINGGNQNITVNGNLVLSNGIANQSIQLNSNSGTITIAGSLIQKGNAAVTFTGTAQLNIGADFIYTAGTFTPGNSTITYNGSGSQEIGIVPYNHLTINKASGIATAAGALAVAGNMTITSGRIKVSTTTIAINGNMVIAAAGILDCDGVYITAGGNWTNSGSYISTTGTVELNGTGTQTISAGNFNHLTVNKASGVAILNGNNTLQSNLNIQSGTLDVATFTLNRSAAGGNFTVGAGSTLLVGGTSNFPSGFSNHAFHVTSQVTYNGTGTQSVAGIAYGNLSFTNGGANAKTLTADAVVTGNLVIGSGSTFHSGGFVLQLSGNWTNNGTFTPATGTVVLEGTAKTVTGTTTFNHLTVTGNYTVAGSNITYNGNLYVTSTGVYAGGNGIATLNGNLTNSGSLTSDGTTNFTGNTVQTLRLENALVSTSTGIVNFNGSVSPVMNSTSSPQFATLNINNTGGINPSVSWTVFVSMNVSAGASFNGGLSTHTIYGAFSNNGIVTSTGALQFFPSTARTVNFGSTGFSSTGIVNLGGSGLLTLQGTPTRLTNVSITNTNAAGVTPPTSWTIDSNFVIASNAIFNAGGYTYTVGGNIESDGTLNEGTSTFIMTSSAGELSAGASSEFYHFTVAGSVTPLTDFRVSGNFTNNGTYDGTIGVLIMTGATAANISGATIPSAIAQLTIEKTANAVVTQQVNISNVLSLNIFSGILFTSTRTITQDAGGGILIINSDATLRLGGTNSLPGFSGYGLDANSTVDYAGTTQNIGNAANYGHLMISAAGNKNALVPFVTQGNLLITAGTLATSTATVTHSIAGNFIMTGGSVTGTTSTFVLNGLNDQTLTLLSNIVNLRLNKATGNVLLGSSITISNTLDFTAGKLSLGNFNCTIGNSGSIINANANNYAITTGSGTLNQQVVSGNNKSFPVGLTSAYTPVNIALTPGSVSDIIQVNLLTAAYADGTSGNMASTNAVNVTWMIAEAVAGGSNATITTQWPATLELPNFSRSLCRLPHYDGTNWEYGPSDLNASGSDPYSVSRAGFTTFSPFAVSTFDLLPLTWLGITGRNEKYVNVIEWSVSRAENNEFFEIQVSRDGVQFSSIGRKESIHTGGLTTSYSFMHRGVTEGTYYYRVKQVDQDGKHSYSGIVRIEVAGEYANKLTVLNNPVASELSIAITSNDNSSGLLMITDASGKVIYKKIISASRGTAILHIDFNIVKAGIYYLHYIPQKGDKMVTVFVKQ